MKILDRYILKQLAIGFALVLVSMTVLVWLTQSLRMVDMIVTKGVSVAIFLKMTFLVLPNFVQILSPLALFAVVLFVFSRMQSDKELMVMQAEGMSNSQIMRAPLIFAFILTVLGYFLTLSLVPYSNTQMREMKWQIKNNLSHLMLQEGQFNSFKNGLTIYIKERLPDGLIKGIIVYDAKNPEKTAVLVAEQGTVFQDDGQTQVVFEKGVRQEITKETNQFSILKFEKYTMFFDEKNENEHRNTDVKEHSLGFLLGAAPNDDITPPTYRKFKVEAARRLLQPIYNFTFVFLAMFGVLAGYYNRRGQVGQINFVVGAALVVQSLALAFENMATKNLMFLPLMFINVFLPIIAVYIALLRSKKFKLSLFKAVLFLGILVFSSAATAFPKMELDLPDKNAPVDFEADAIEYSKNNETLTAIGNVVVTQNDMTLRTQKLIYDRKNDQAIAPGKVTVTMSDGTVTTADDMVLTDHMKNAVAKQMTMQIYDGTYITASKMKRTDNGTVLYLRNLTYTPCDRCEGQAPLWQLRAKAMKHDANEKVMSYRHTFLEVKDVPIFYFPYVQMPDFSVKRKTGFLSPSLQHGRTMGSGISTPFFWDISPNQNFTFTPTFTPTHFPLGVADYQAIYDKGYMNFQASGTKDDDENTNFQGHVKADFQYYINNEWRASGEIFRSSSDTYFRKYKIPKIDENQSVLTSHLTAERFGTQNYFNMRALSFQSLQASVSGKSIPYVIPTGHFEYQTDPLSNGLYAFSEVDGAIIHNRERFKSDRISVTQGVRLPYITSYGAVFDFIGTVRADGYNIDTGRYGYERQGIDSTYTTGRVYPVASLEASYPLATTTKHTTQVLRPVVMAVVAPNDNMNTDKIPDTDSLAFDFDDTNLFSRNRYAGYDRVETGTRFNYGAEWSVFTNTNAAFSALFGQSYRLKEDRYMNDLMGEDKNFSDYVGRVSVDYKYMSLAYRFRLAENNLSFKKNEITLSGGGDPLRLGIDYVYLKNTTLGDTFYPSREEILVFGSSRLTKQWSITGFYRYDLAADGGPIESGATLRYDNECTAILFDLSKEFTRDRDYKGGTSFMVKFVLKTLGGM